MEKIALILNRTDGSFEPVDKDITLQTLSPKAMMLYGAAKCMGMTTIMLLKKMDVTPVRFIIEVNGELSEMAIPAQNIFTMINYKFTIECDNPKDHQKINHAIELAHNKYCGMSRMMKMIAPVSYDIYIHTQKPEQELV